MISPNTVRVAIVFCEDPNDNPDELLSSEKALEIAEANACSLLIGPGFYPDGSWECLLSGTKANRIATLGALFSPEMADELHDFDQSPATNFAE